MAIWFPTLAIIIALERQCEIIGWFPDRDNMTNWCDGIWQDYADWNLHAFADALKVDMRNTKFAIGAPNRSGAEEIMWCDYMIRAADWFAGSVAAWDRKNNLIPGEHAKYQQMLDDVMADAVNIVILHLDMTDSGSQFGRIKHTRDWVGWECGVAAATALETNKDVWVIEPIAEIDGLSVVIPHLRHYVSFDETKEFWQGYFTQIIMSYDDSHFLKAMSAGAVTGAALGKAEGALWGAGAGMVLAAIASQTKPVGLPIRCPQCFSFYSVHLTEPRMRCPVCNTRLFFPTT